jgi:Mrp family chromosome partitioning ATPase
LAEVLTGSSCLADAINRSWSEHVHVLPAGRLTQSPHKLLRPETFAAVAEEARATYGYVVIDTPPVLAASEALVIAKVADGTLVCTMRDRSREPHVRQAIRRLRATAAEPLGVVLSGVPVRSYAYRYGSYGYVTSPAE